VLSVLNGHAIYLNLALVAQGDGKGAQLSTVSTESRAGGLLMSDPRGPSHTREASSTDNHPRCTSATAIQRAVPVLEQ
jgi:hypothetical protein